MILVLFGGSRNEECVGGDGGGGDVGRHERARYCNVDGHGVRRASTFRFKAVRLQALRRESTGSYYSTENQVFECVLYAGFAANALKKGRRTLQRHRRKCFVRFRILAGHSHTWVEQEERFFFIPHA